MKPSEITDDMQFIGATVRGHKTRIYDDGFGPLWVLRDSLGVSGIVRARTWEDAYAIAEDEIFPEASETVEELRSEFGFRREHVKIVIDPETGAERPVRPEDYVAGRLPDGRFRRWETRETPDSEAWTENELFLEAYGFRPNGPNERDALKHGIYAKDLNGEVLDRLTDSLAEDLGIEIEAKLWE